MAGGGGRVDLLGIPGYAYGGWFFERGAYQTFAYQVRIVLPGSSSYLLGRNVGPFHRRP